MPEEMPEETDSENLSDGEKLVQLQEAIKEAVIGYNGTITALQDERDSFLKQWQRSQADLVNYKNRSIKDKEIAVREVTRSFLEKLIPILDSIDFALSSIGPEQEVTVIKPFLMLKESFLKVLSEYSVSQILPSLGDPFNPEIHQAISVVETADVESQIVGNIARVGYMIEDCVFRPSDVVVHKPLSLDNS